MLGYYKDEKTTNKVLFEDSEGTKWLATGDYGYLEESGCSSIVENTNPSFIFTKSLR